MNDQKDYLDNIKEPVKNSVATLVLGILSLVTCIIYGIPSLILSIIALAISAEPKRNYMAYPEHYDKASYGQLNGGRVCAIIGLCLSIAFILVWGIALIAALSIGHR
jgi:hypothetical protein